jgi:hypothetical protein
LRALIYDGNYFSPNLDFLYVRLRNSLQLSQPSLLFETILPRGNDSDELFPLFLG